MTPEETYYMSEACPIFALAMKMVNEKLTIFIIVGKYGKQKIYPHVFCGYEGSDMGVDVLGVRRIKDIVGAYYDVTNKQYLRITPDQLKSLCGASDRKPFHAATKKDIKEAAEIIRSNFDKYDIRA